MVVIKIYNKVFDKSLGHPTNCKVSRSPFTDESKKVFKVFEAIFKQAKGAIVKGEYTFSEIHFYAISVVCLFGRIFNS